MKSGRAVTGPPGMSRTLYQAMTDNSMPSPPGGPARPSSRRTRPGSPGGALLTAVLILVGSVVMGLVGGAIWAAAAPRVAYQVASLNPPTAYATNPETSAFIAADGWYCFIALAGGALIGLLGYLFGVRRYGPGPMIAIAAGSVAAAFIASWLGHQLSGGPGFDHVLATSRIGTLLHAPIALGSRGGLAFWPLAAAGVAGGIELVGVLKARHQAAYGGAPIPGMDSFDTPAAPVPRCPGQNSGQQGSGQQGSGQQGSGQQGSGQRSLGGQDAALGKDARGAADGQEEQGFEPGHGAADRSG
jgi:hypothetical protein